MAGIPNESANNNCKIRPVQQINKQVSKQLKEIFNCLLTFILFIKIISNVVTITAKTNPKKDMVEIIYFPPL